ncbi:DUF5677 domain-containing protein [Burkholderia metallica]|uniref:DUF5677 domain-containing protein n=1 Tax=Burkholderia metallica TaxID=488729 RepID=A0ABT8PIM9_9BURK|nr:DUF5677 domain-containing protein [Burkholderia metallica]MDN7934979.1 DUF5677 domain-containing protein [Burkholderia metallica]
MKNFREIVADYLDDHPETKGKIADSFIDQWLSENADKMIDKFAGQLAESLDSQQLEFVEGIHSDVAGFQERLFETWRAPLTRLDSLIAMCMEIGSEINVEYRSPGAHSPSSRRNITTRLHTRAVQIANEISCLLKGGYADGAMARWRSLHETTVILAFLGRHDDALASRFVDFQAIIRLKAATEYNEHHAALGFDPIDQAELAQYQTDRDAMLAKYGPSFANENGWAADVLKQKRVTFKDIEKFVELSYLRPQYGFASKNIHAGIDSIGYKLALSMSGKELLLAGPSNEGLIEPIQCTSYSLIFATGELIDTAPHDERSIMEGVLWRWHERLKIELIDAHDALRKRGESGRD